MPPGPEHRARLEMVAREVGGAINTVVERLNVSDAELIDVLTGAAAMVAIQHDRTPVARAAFLEYSGESWDRMLAAMAVPRG